MKTCIDCKMELSFDNFYIRKSKKDGYDNKCKKCKSVYNRKYRCENIDKIEEYRELNREKILISSKKLYLESKFEPWMNWENRGLYNGEFNHGWDIDHIIPISSAETEEDLIKLNHYTNLQPLCSKVNRNIKKNKIEYETY